MSSLYVLFAALPWAAICQDCDLVGECDVSGQSVNFLQTGMMHKEQTSLMHKEMPKPEREEHFWGHPKGSIGSLSQTRYGVPASALHDLDAHLAWKWALPMNLSAFVWGTLIDKDKNIIVASMQGLYKYTADGEPLWNRTDIHGTMMPVLMGDSLYGMQAGSAQMYALNLQTGDSRWMKKISQTTGQEGDMMEAHNGVLVTAVDQQQHWTTPEIGIPAKRAIGVNATTAEELWSYTPQCGIWNIMALFPDEDSTVFMDYCGGLYRVNLHDGSEIWKAPGSFLSMTDGGSTLGPDGNIYTCSNGPLSMVNMNDKDAHAGRLRKFDVNTGKLLWETKLQNACMNFPAVSADGKTVVLSDGANVIDPPMKWLHGKGNTSEEIDQFWKLQQELLANKTQLNYYGKDNLNASILGFDASTGSLKWEHKVDPWYGMSFALDEERAYLWLKGKHPFGWCGPPHWSGPVIDQEGKVYVARSDGMLHIYNPSDDSDTEFRHGDGALMSGVAFANGLMVVPTCSWVYVFKF